MDTVKRIFELADSQFKEQKSFAAAIGVSDKIVSQWRVGTTRSYRTRIATIADVLGTTTEYLLTGNGPKKNTAPIGVSDSDTKPDWVIKFEELSPDAQKEVIAFIEFKRGQE